VERECRRDEHDPTATSSHKDHLSDWRGWSYSRGGWNRKGVNLPILGEQAGLVVLKPPEPRIELLPKKVQENYQIPKEGRAGTLSNLISIYTSEGAD